MIRKLFIVLLIPALAWAAVGYPGCTYQKTVTYTAAKILENGTYAAYIDLSELGITWWSNCSLSTNIVITYANNDTLSKWPDAFDKSIRTGIVWCNPALNTTGGGVVRVQTGKTVNRASNPKVFTDCNMAMRYGLEEASGTVADACGTYPGSTNGCTYGATGVIGKGMGFVQASNSYINSGDVTQLNSASAFTVSMWASVSNLAAYPYLFAKQTAGSLMRAEFYPTGGPTFTIEGGLTNYILDAGNTVSALTHFVFRFNGGGTGNIQRAQIYVNGVIQTDTTYAGSIPATSGNFGGYGLYWGSARVSPISLTGVIDEPRVYSTAKSADYIATDYNLQNHKAVAVYSITDSGAVNDGVLSSYRNITKSRLKRFGF